jgi:transposase-like protein
MYSSTTLGIHPRLARLPMALALLVILGLIFQIDFRPTPCCAPPLPPVSLPAERWSRLARQPQGRPSRFRLRSRAWRIQSGLRLLVRAGLLEVLLHTSGGLALTPWSQVVLLLPLLQTLSTGWRVRRPASRPPTPVMLAVQRSYQLTLVLLLIGSVVQVLLHLHRTGPGGLFPIGLAAWAVQPDDQTEIRITTEPENYFQVALRGAFTLVWEPRDSFEKWMLLLFLRRLHRPGHARPVLTQHQVGQAFGTCQHDVSVWENQVRQHSWHYLSDRFRHALQSVLPAADVSQAILKVWVPAFWLSAWDVRERLIDLGVVADRAALDLEALTRLAQHTGFSRVRELLLERFDLQAGHLTRREHWWLNQLLALNERLIGKLERGEALTPQELVEIEPLRLKHPEKSADSEAPAPLAACLKSALFKPAPETRTAAEARTEPVRCTYCDSDQVAPKSKQPRRKTLIDEFGEKQVVDVVRYYCHNPACPYGTFTYLPQGVLPHSAYPVQVRLLAVEVYVQLMSTYRRSARMLAVKASTVYHWVATVSPAALCLAAYLGAVRTSGVVGIDDKWVQVCSPSAVRPHGTRPRAVWRYVYMAVDAYSSDLLAIQIYPEHSDESVRLFLLELKAKGIRPRVVVSDLDPAYGRMLPQIFPQAVHHECIFHAVQNARNQMTKVYGRNYRELRPDTVPLHDAITELFHAQTQKTVRKRYAELMALRSAYVAKTPDIACVFDSLEHHFPKLVNAIESPDIPRTNNATELVIRRFDQHYQSMCGLDSFESAQVYLRLFELVYRLTPFMEDNPGDKAGKCPLELAGYDLKALPIADFFTNLKLPALVVPPQVVSQ